jgi:hypothetical protein
MTVPVMATFELDAAEEQMVDEATVADVIVVVEAAVVEATVVAYELMHPETTFFLLMLLYLKN